MTDNRPNQVNQDTHSTRDLRNTASLQQVPDGTLDNIASFLRGRDVAFLASSSSRIGTAIQPHAARARTTHEAARVRDLGAFRTVLNNVGGLRSDLQADAMVRLGSQLPSLTNGAEEAVRTFRQAVWEMPDEHRTDELAGVAADLTMPDPAFAAAARGANLREVAHTWNIAGTARLRQMERASIESLAPGSAGGLVRAGRPVHEVIAEHGIGPEGSRELEVVAARVVSELVAAGSHVREVADRFGISSVAGLITLERAAVRSTHPRSAGSLVRGGRDVQEVAQAHGLTTATGTRDLQIAATQSDEAGSVRSIVTQSRCNIQQVAGDRGITDGNALLRLEAAAASSDHPASAGALARAGHNVRNVAQTYGFTRRQGIIALEMRAIEGVAGGLARLGRNIQEIASEFGISSNPGLIALARISIESQDPGSAGAMVRAGGDPRHIASEHGITLPESINALEQVAARRIRPDVDGSGSDPQLP